MGLLIIFVIIVGMLIFYANLTRNKQIEQAKKDDEYRKARKEREQREYEELIANAKKQMQVMEVLRQAKLVGDKDTEADVLNGTYDGELPEELSNGMYTSVFNHLDIINIAGINYRGNLSAYVGDFNGVLVPEPKNDYDPNAIMIKCEDGKHIGYVPEDLTASIRERLGDDFKRYRITGTIEEHEEYDDEDDYEDERTRKFFTGYINIVYK